MSTVEWPVAALGPLARARAMAAGLPGAGYAEGTIAVPFADMWPRLMDLERSVPAADRLVASIEVTSRRTLADGAEQLRVRTRSPLRLPLDFDVRVEDGFCLMRGDRRRFVVVMAAEPDPDDPGGRTRYAHVEAVPRRLARPLRPLMDRIVAADIVGFRRHLEA